MEQDKAATFKKNNASTFWLYVDSRQHHDLQGEVWHELSGDVFRYVSVQQLLLFVDRHLDRYGYLPPTHRMRRWTGQADWSDEEEFTVSPRLRKKEQATIPSFVVRVQFRQNATWQGTIQWLEGGQTTAFRSTLELIRLMEQVVDQCDLPGSEVDEQDGEWAEAQEN